MSVTYLEAIREAQAKLLRDDERVFIYGQDISGKFGGPFKATKGLPEKFPGRVLNTPISEAAIAGVCLGAAMGGLRPIGEIMFMDFVLLALDQLIYRPQAAFDHAAAVTAVRQWLRLALRPATWKRTALESARSEGIATVVICPFVRAYLRRHPELRAESIREEDA